MADKPTDPRVAAFAELLGRVDAFRMRNSAAGSYEKAGQLLADFNMLAAECGIADMMSLRIAAAGARFGDPAADIDDPNWVRPADAMEAGRQFRTAIARALLDLAGGLVPEKVAHQAVADLLALSNGLPHVMPIPTAHGNKSGLHREAAYQQLFLRAHYEAARTGGAWERWLEEQKLSLPISSPHAFRDRNRKIPMEARGRARRLGTAARKGATIPPEDQQWLESNVMSWPIERLAAAIFDS